MSPRSALRHIHLVPGLLVLALLAVWAIPSSAQEITYTTVTNGEFGGSMGAMMQMIPGANDPIRETTFIKGALMRTDSEGTSTITNATDGTFTYLNHEDRTYYVVTMEQMAQMGAAMAQGQVEPEEAGAEEEPKFDVRFSTDRTGRTRDFGGYSAEEVLMVVEIIPKEEAMEEEGVEAGTMVLFTQLWMSTNFPGYEAFQAAQAQMGEAFMESGGGEGMAAAFAQDPRMKEAFVQNADALKALEGMPVRTVSSFVTVPYGQQFDRDAVVAGLDQPLAQGGGMGAAIGQAAAQGAANAARDAMRNLGGMFGRRNRQEPPPEPEQPEAAAPQTQMVLMRTTSTIENVRTSGISDDTFQVPAGYTRIEGMGGGGTR